MEVAVEVLVDVEVDVSVAVEVPVPVDVEVDVSVEELDNKNGRNKISEISSSSLDARFELHDRKTKTITNAMMVCKMRIPVTDPWNLLSDIHINRSSLGLTIIAG